jgi:hypothetical protein
MKKQYRANGRKVARKRLKYAWRNETKIKFARWAKGVLDEVSRRPYTGEFGAERVISPRPGVPGRLIASGAIPIHERREK